MGSFFLTLTPIVILYLAWTVAWLGLLIIPYGLTWLGKCLRDGSGLPRIAEGKLVGAEYLISSAIGVAVIYMIAELVEMYVSWM